MPFGLRAIHRASEGYRGEARTDAKHAAVIADQARIRRDLRPLPTGDETVTDLKILTSRRMDLAADRTRTVNQLRSHLTSIFPGLEPGALRPGCATAASVTR
ncbi:transposase [Streptomyces sp. NPDC020362]|uniref:IS110 family transposase n=1 Tax=unclassified Streptomyces TaxID=2593676 RepID=UPI000AB9B2B6